MRLSRPVFQNATKNWTWGCPRCHAGAFPLSGKTSPETIWFRLSIKDWSKSNGRCYQTGLKAIQDLAAASGDFEAPAGRKRVAQALSPAVARGAQEFKFRCLQIKRKGRNASFVWHVAPRSRLLWDKEPLFYLRDKQTERHVRRQLRSLDIEVTKDGDIIFGNLVCEQLELGLNVPPGGKAGARRFRPHIRRAGFSRADEPGV